MATRIPMIHVEGVRAPLRDTACRELRQVVNDSRFGNLEYLATIEVPDDLQARHAELAAKIAEPGMRIEAPNPETAGATISDYSIAPMATTILLNCEAAGDPSIFHLWDAHHQPLRRYMVRHELVHAMQHAVAFDHNEFDWIRPRPGLTRRDLLIYNAAHICPEYHATRRGLEGTELSAAAEFFKLLFPGELIRHLDSMRRMREGRTSGSSADPILNDLIRFLYTWAHSLAAQDWQPKHVSAAAYQDHELFRLVFRPHEDRLRYFLWDWIGAFGISPRDLEDEILGILEEIYRDLGVLIDDHAGHIDLFWT